MAKILHLKIKSYLIIAAIITFLACESKKRKEQLAETPKFKCLPCNLDCDTIVFKEEGKCPNCNMKLIPLKELEGLSNFTINETTFINNSLKLVADIFIPNNPNRRKIGICLIQGSGASGRDNLWAREHAEFLSANGYYVLLPDKRGVGKSKGDWKYSSYEELAYDAIMSVKHLRNKFQLNEVGLIGLSEGGRIAPHAAAIDSTIDFVVNIVSSTLKLKNKMIQEMTNTARQEGLSPNEIAEMHYLHVLLWNYIKTNNWEPLGEYYEKLKKSSWADFAKTFPQTKDHWKFDFFGKNLDHDPIPFYKKVEQDVFVAYGAEDEADNVPVYESTFLLQSAYYDIGKTNYEIHIYPAGHSLRDSLTGVLLNQYKNDLLEWLNKQ